MCSALLLQLICLSMLTVFMRVPLHCALFIVQELLVTRDLGLRDWATRDLQSACSY